MNIQFESLTCPIRTKIDVKIDIAEDINAKMTIVETFEVCITYKSCIINCGKFSKNTTLTIFCRWIWYNSANVNPIRKNSWCKNFEFKNSIDERHPPDKTETNTSKYSHVLNHAAK